MPVIAIVIRLNIWMLKSIKKVSDDVVNEEYCKKLLSVLLETGTVATAFPKISTISILSNEGKVLVALMQNDGLIMKDIPHLTGVSFRSTFNCIRKFEVLGIVEKIRSTEDKRAVTLHLNRKILCQLMCRSANDE